MNTGNSHGDFLAALNGARPEPVSVLEIAAGSKPKPKPKAKPEPEDVEDDPSEALTIDEGIEYLESTEATYRAVGADLFSEELKGLEQTRKAFQDVKGKALEDEKRDERKKAARLHERLLKQRKYEEKRNGKARPKGKQ